MKKSGFVFLIVLLESILVGVGGAICILRPKLFPISIVLFVVAFIIFVMIMV